MRSAVRILALLAFPLVLAACELPRGAAVQAEILEGAGDPEAEFAVYPVTRDSLPVLAEWPLPGEPHLRWMAASQGARGQRIAPGDTLSLTVWDSNENSLFTAQEQRQVELSSIRVAPDGTIFVPYLGETRVGGLSPEAARERVQQELETIIPSAQVQLMLVEGRGNSVDLVGGVGAPGTYQMPDRDFTVLSLISRGGGVLPSLQNPQIRLMRGGRIFGTSINRLFSEPELDTRLAGGDRVIIEEDRRYFLSLGAAGEQNQHRFTQDVLSALDAMAIIGGVNAGRADPQGVLILREYPPSSLDADRRGPREQRVVFTLDLTSSDGLFSARNFRISPGDLVLVTESPVSNARTVFGLIGSAFGVAGGLSNL